ncbi:aminotransferase class V-fold PLP-dependent enzyme [Hydrogenoanaerobacterium sp.]|uniref:aminotransferase class I/II-fold pyridoxal phosphate-dependent enzyme n=1 Tax=Hydrogenoanaerobacterium sp. TaxID=2953763 RepID=UPI0028A196AC|nr:aminotransferase class V-fold PLP-dependent enzyme [Hydrogenoanaerobacterium sp.]
MEKQTPLLKAVNEYIKRDAARFHMPGHKGFLMHREPDRFSEAYRYDITEVQGADSLYEAHGAIRETEEAFARIYGAKRTLLSAGGATLCIQTMLALVAKEGGKVIAGRNLHTSAVSAMALLGLSPIWVYPDQSAGCGMGGRLSPEDIRAQLQNNTDVCAVYITTPDYFGILSDVEGIAKICRAYRVPLLVDNSHGSHLKFRKPSLHPIDLGADLCCDSLHKTMPVLTGGALLHIANERYIPAAKQRMSLFGSTSPSYLIMLSCDRCIGYIEKGEVQAEFDAVCARIRALEQMAENKGFVLLEAKAGTRDYTKLVLSVYNWGISGAEFGERLRLWGIEPEYVSDVWAVLMASPENLGGDYRRVEKFLNAWDLPSVQDAAPAQEVPRLQPAMTLRSAVFAPSEMVPVENSIGRIASAMVCPCPPGIPVVMPGEKIDQDAVKLLKTCGICCIKVVL